MKNFKFYLMAALVAATTCTGFTSCSDDDDAESTVNPATRVVAETKKYDTAILLCTFGSTYNESLDVYNEIIADFRKQFPQTDIYMSFTSRTCIGRAEASTGEARYKLGPMAESHRRCRIYTRSRTVASRHSRRGIPLSDEYRYQEKLYD